MNVTDVLAPWGVVNEVLGLSTPVRDESHYKALLAFVDECFERFVDDPHHPIFALVHLLAERIREYEDRVHPWPNNSTPAAVIGFLLESHGLLQCDLPEVGSQGVVSEVLAGKRTLNARQVAALAKRFRVSADVFLS